jgi:hypothetical protein
MIRASSPPDTGDGATPSPQCSVRVRRVCIRRARSPVEGAVGRTRPCRRPAAAGRRSEQQSDSHRDVAHVRWPRPPRRSAPRPLGDRLGQQQPRRLEFAGGPRQGHGRGGVGQRLGPGRRGPWWPRRVQSATASLRGAEGHGGHQHTAEQVGGHGLAAAGCPGAGSARVISSKVIERACRHEQSCARTVWLPVARETDRIPAVRSRPRSSGPRGSAKTRGASLGVRRARRAAPSARALSRSRTPSAR